MCRLLYFLAEKENTDPEYSAKEYEIATVVFGRRSDFDPRTGSSSRVQIARLRAKLIEYYTSDGVIDEIHIEIPEGAYRLQYVANPKVVTKSLGSDRRVEYRTEQPGQVPVEVLSTEAAGQESPRGQPAVKTRFISWLVLATVLASLVLGGFLGRMRVRRDFSDTSPGILPPDSALRTFWGVFVADPEQTWVIFSNARFVGNPVGGLRYFDAKRDTAQSSLAFYTGVGEVVGVHELDHLFASFGKSTLVKRAAQLSLEDVKNTNLIFLGAPTENSSLANLAVLRSFRFQEISSGEREGQVEILNKDPRPGEQPSYMIENPPSQPLVDDYAVIAMLPGMTPSHRIFVSAGTTTIGTLAAVKYVCNPDSVATLLKHLGSSGTTRSFEALLHITIVNDVPLKTDVILVHELR